MLTDNNRRNGNFLDSPHIRGRIKDINGHYMTVNLNNKLIKVYHPNPSAYKINQSVVVSNISGQYKILDRPMLLSKEKEESVIYSFWFSMFNDSGYIQKLSLYSKENGKIDYGKLKQISDNYFNEYIREYISNERTHRSVYSSLSFVSLYFESYIVSSDGATYERTEVKPSSFLKNGTGLIVVNVIYRDTYYQEYYYRIPIKLDDKKEDDPIEEIVFPEFEDSNLINMVNGNKVYFDVVDSLVNIDETIESSLIKTHNDLGDDVKYIDTSDIVDADGNSAELGLKDIYIVEKKVDICFIIDCSGSMGSEIAGVSNSIEKNAGIIKSIYSDHVRFSAVIYGQNNPTPHSFNFTENNDAVVEFIRSQPASGGTEYARAAVNEALSLGWRSDENVDEKIIVLITDENSDDGEPSIPEDFYSVLVASGTFSNLYPYFDKYYSLPSSGNFDFLLSDLFLEEGLEFVNGIKGRLSQYDFYNSYLPLIGQKGGNLLPSFKDRVYDSTIEYIEDEDFTYSGYSDEIVKDFVYKDNFEDIFLIFPSYINEMDEDGYKKDYKFSWLTQNINIDVYGKNYDIKASAAFYPKYRDYISQGFLIGTAHIVLVDYENVRIIKYYDNREGSFTKKIVNLEDSSEYTEYDVGNITYDLGHYEIDVDMYSDDIYVYSEGAFYLERVRYDSYYYTIYTEYVVNNNKELSKLFTYSADYKSYYDLLRTFNGRQFYNHYSGESGLFFAINTSTLPSSEDVKLDCFFTNGEEVFNIYSSIEYYDSMYFSKFLFTPDGMTYSILCCSGEDYLNRDYNVIVIDKDNTLHSVHDINEFFNFDHYYFDNLRFFNIFNYILISHSQKTYLISSDGIELKDIQDYFDDDIYSSIIMGKISNFKVLFYVMSDVYDDRFAVVNFSDFFEKITDENKKMIDCKLKDIADRPNKPKIQYIDDIKNSDLDISDKQEKVLYNLSLLESNHFIYSAYGYKYIKD